MEINANFGPPPKEGEPHVPPFTIVCSICKQMFCLPGIKLEPGPESSAIHWSLASAEMMRHFEQHHADTTPVQDGLGVGNSAMAMILSRSFECDAPQYKEARYFAFEVLQAALDPNQEPPSRILLPQV